jgi:hypothetical protein
MRKKGSQLMINCDKLKLVVADGEKYFTNVTDVEKIFIYKILKLVKIEKWIEKILWWYSLIFLVNI